MSDAEFEIVNADAGASSTFPKQAGNVRKSDLAMLKGFPCRVIDTATSKTGKHGHAKINLTGVDIFTGRKYEDVYPTSHNLEVPIVKKTELMVTELDEDLCILMDNEGNMTEVRLLSDEDEYSKKLRELFAAGQPTNDVYASLIEWDGRSQVVSVREAKHNA